MLSNLESLANAGPVLSKARYRTLLELARQPARDGEVALFLDGWRWLEEALDLARPLECVLVGADAPRSAAEAALLSRARATAGECHEATAEQLARLTGSVTAPGVAMLVRWSPATLESLLRSIAPAGPALVVALDAVADPGNAGTIVRTADWFGAAGVIFGAGSAAPSNAKVARATMGSLFHLPIVGADELGAALARLRENGFAIVGAALDGAELADFAWPARSVLVVGNEANGLRPGLLAAQDRRVRIRAHGRAESLNAAIAAAILTHAWRRVQAE